MLWLACVVSGIGDFPPPLPAGSTPGHIFICNSDLRHLACDAWLVPVDTTMEVDARWKLEPSEIPERPDAWGASEYVVQCKPPTSEAARRRLDERFYSRLPFLTLVQGTAASRPTISMLVVALRQFLGRIIDLHAAGGLYSRFDRALPLVALPIFGADIAARGKEALSGHSDTGEIILAMLHELHQFTSEHAIDVALCTVDSAAFGAAQTARRMLLGEFKSDNRGRLWRLRLPSNAADHERYYAVVERLSDEFLAGRVSLFLGAGVSINAGLPSWKQLIDILAGQISLPAHERMTLAQLNPLEAASVLAQRYGGHRALKRACAHILSGAKRHSLQHALLAGLPFKGTVTTNFDELFELAVKGTGKSMAVLPADIGGVRDRWCLKMHGTCGRPETIILTRHDYGMYGRSQAASEGVLQALLMTQHLLFVGFSMRDENWCRIVETVRASLEGEVGISTSMGGAGGDGGGAGDAGGSIADEGGSIADGEGASGADTEAVEVEVEGGESEGRRLGTMLPLEGDSLFDSLWARLLHVEAIDQLHAHGRAGGEAGGGDGDERGGEGDSREGTAGVPSPRIAQPSEDNAGLPERFSHLANHARNLEIFLDHLGACVESRQCRILLNEKFETLLSPRSTALNRALLAFVESLPEDAKRAGPFRPVLEMLLRLGLRTETLRRLLDNDELEGPYRRQIREVIRE